MMTKDRAAALKPGDILTWGKRPEHDKCIHTDYGHDVFFKDHGKDVTFVDFARDNDPYGFPIIVVRTQKGFQTLSSRWFE